VKRVVPSKQKVVGKNRKKLRFLAKGGTPSFVSNTLDLDNLEVLMVGFKKVWTSI